MTSTRGKILIFHSRITKILFSRYLYEGYHHLLESFDQPRLGLQQLELYANAVQDKNEPQNSYTFM